MILLSLNEVGKFFSSEPVLDGVTFDIRRGEHVCLVGPNGAGKSTLMSIITGQLPADRGQVDTGKGIEVGILEQRPNFSAADTVWSVAEQAMEKIHQLADRMQQLTQQMADESDSAQIDRFGREYEVLQTELENRGGFNFEYKIKTVLAGLGFGEDVYRQPANKLSGGQQNRLLLGKLLLAEPDLMLLDEPSNHLDVAATEWLENFLKASRQAFLLVSHDRLFLDRVADRTLELFHGSVDSYPGNYSKYKMLKSERLEVQRRTYDKQTEEIAKLEDFVRRHHHGQKSAQAEDRRKKLERIERVALPREIVAPPMKFPAAARSGDIVLRADKIGKAFDRPLFERLSFQIERGQRWGIMGANGAGKTTLLRCILGECPLDSGGVQLGTGVKPAYFDQQLQCVADGDLAEDAVRPPHKEFNLSQRRDMLAKFGITGKTAEQPVSSLSGGERNRVALALLASLDANLLVLDEPTNHLDLWARDALETALKAYDGTLLIVSHDRYLLNQVCDHLLVVADGGVQVIEGNYDTYCMMSSVKSGAGQQVTQANTSRSQTKTLQTSAPAPRRQQPKSQSRKRKRKFPYRKVEELENEIELNESKISQLHQDLSDPEFLRDGEQVKEANLLLFELNTRLSELYEHWEEASELNG